MLLSVLMPSNRDLAASRRSIETALRFCEKRDALLVVSDNSGDPDKRRLLENASPRLRYITPEREGSEANLLNLCAAAETEFILMMGDDDELFVSPKDQPIDLATVDPAHIGVRPMVAVTNSEGRVIRVKDFAILDDTPSARVMTYNANAKGDNATYYSIFRRRPFVELHRFFFAYHPLKGGYCDWALATTMFATGKMVYDPGTIYKYNHHRWDRRDKIDERMQAIYEDAGLPPNADQFSLLLLYLDLMILALRRGSPLNEAEKDDLARNAGWPILENFCRRVAGAPETFTPETTAHCRRLAVPAGVEAQFDIAVELADQLLPGLATRYRAFHQVSLAA